VVGTLPVINAVPGQMRQLFQNLISNSLKFSNKEGAIPTIIIEAKKIPLDTIKELNINPAEFVCISVKDNGIGFENEYKEKIFGVFQRLHGRNYEGTGIGLAIARKIVENHGGYITAHGELNKCAEFFILLPKA
jgi:two-component system, chemotaxis family, CheB/CheR fusion protein